MSLPEKLLLLASRTRDEPDLPGGIERWDQATALDLLRREFPMFDRRVAGASLLDFGCGDGWQSVAIASGGVRDVIGVDTNPCCLARAHALAAGLGIKAVEFYPRIPPGRFGTFDVVISQMRSLEAQFLSETPDRPIVAKDLLTICEAIRTLAEKLSTFVPEPVEEGVA